MREQPFFPAGQEHGVELQPLGGVQRHDGGLGLVLAGLLYVHDQRDVFEKAFHGLELVHGADKLFQVFQPARRFGVLVLLVHFRVAGLVQDDLGNLGVGQGGDLAAPAVELAEQIAATCAPWLQLFGGDDVLGGAIERDAGGAGYSADLLHRTVTDAALGRVDDALKARSSGDMVTT
jgi:hypothetical protein